MKYRYIYSIFLILHVFTLQSMESLELKDYVKLVSPNGTVLDILHTDLLPFADLSRYENTLTSYIAPSFIPLLRALLYAQATWKCTEPPYLPCTSDVEKILKKFDYLQDFISWFELLYLMDLFSFSSPIKDSITRHIALHIKDKEQEAAQAIETINNPARNLSMVRYWQKIASYYKKIFKQSLVLEGIKKHKTYSLGELILLKAIDPTVIKIIVDSNRKYGGLIVDLSGLPIESLDGWDSLISLLPTPTDRSNASLSHIRKLYINNTPLKTLPHNFLHTCTNLNELYITESKLATLPPHFLSTCTRLEKVQLNNNNISILPEDFLNSCTQLKYLDLNFNQIALLPDTFLATCNQLKELSLSNNTLTSLPEQFLQNCTEIREIDLAFNRIKQLPKNFLMNCINLEELDLSNNLIEQIPSDFLSTCNELTNIDLSSNALAMIPPAFLSNCKELVEISLKGNAITELPTDFLSHDLPLLEIVDMAGNALNFIPPSFLNNTSDDLNEVLVQNKDESYPNSDSNPIVAKFIQQEQNEKKQESNKRKTEDELEDQPEEKKRKID